MPKRKSAIIKRKLIEESTVVANAEVFIPFAFSYGFFSLKRVECSGRKTQRGQLYIDKARNIVLVVVGLYG